MPLAEAYRCVESESERYSYVHHGPGYAVFAFDPESLGGISKRIALTHRIGRHLGSFLPGDIHFDEISIPEGSFSVRAKRFRGMLGEVDSQELVRDLGGHLSKTNRVELKAPSMEIRIFLSDRIHVFMSEKETDRDILETRKVGERPFFSPISLHPKFARAAINLTGAKTGDKVLDPFCGTGGIVIESAFMGMKAIASDFDETMIMGCRENMDHYGLTLSDSAVIDIGDVPERFGEVDAVVTDPPYGRSTHTGGEDIASIYERAMASVSAILKRGGRLCIVLPYEIDSEDLIKENVYVQKVHGSLSRYYHVFRKP